MQRWKERYTTAMSESPRDMSKIPLLAGSYVEIKIKYSSVNKSLYTLVLRDYNE